MKKLLIIHFCITASFLSTAQSKDEKSVAAATDSLIAAMISGNVSSLEKWTDEKLSYGHSGGLVEDKATFIEKFRTGKSDFVTIDESDRTVSVFGKAAVVRHSLSATTNDNGVAGAVKIKVLLVWQKSGKQWKLVARQAVKPTT